MRSGGRSSTKRSMRFLAPTPDDGGDDLDFDPDEDLLDKAIEIVVQTQTASVSLSSAACASATHVQDG